MKHIFKRFHFGGGHDPSRPSHEISASGVPSSSATSPTAWCGSNHRRRGGGAVGRPEIAAPPSPSPSPSPEEGSARAAADRADYFSSEEEFQVQLALAISASNSEFREDRDNEQIREATRLSLGKQQTDSAGEEDTAELLSRRYWVSDGGHFCGSIPILRRDIRHASLFIAYMNSEPLSVIRQ